MALSNVRPLVFSIPRFSRQLTTSKPFAALLMLAVGLCAAAAKAQSADRIPQSFDPTPSVVLTGHHPQWAIPANDQGALDANKVIDNMTMVLQRSPAQQKAFDQLLEDQQNPGSPEYHHWLTPVEIGTRFGVSDHDIATISGWLESQGLHVNWVAPSKIFIAFGGTAASIGRAFGVPMHAYKVQGDDRISVVSDPMVPSALAPSILAVRGLYTVRERPQHSMRVQSLNTPDITLAAGNYVLGPADFAKIYDLPTTLTGSGVNIGIVAEAHVDPADVSEFQSFLGASFNTPTQVVPTAQGGVDPGPAYTTEPSCESANPPTCSSSVADYIDAQGEATLDVTRAGSVAPAANVVLVTAEVNNSTSDGIYTDAQYIVATTASPGPFQVMSISFGGCESEGGQSDVDAWDSIYQTAQGEGISVFVSSGDSGAAGCDTHGAAPPATAGVASPNALCSSQHDTCVGGTEFNDAGDYSAYWSNTNGTGFESALSYIPEGAWNEPGSSPNFQVAASGGGVSAYIATPPWQTGTGVPSARAGRYTPDVAFSASAHDAYFACLAVTGGTCISTAQGTPFVEFSGTSASAPDMAGIAALLDQKMGSGQGNINPTVYSLAASDPTAFHDVTVSTSGVSSCAVTTPSMCNNSIASSTALTGGTQGYLVQTGYDEVTGLGSLDVNTFITDYAASASKITPTVAVTPGSSPITIGESLTVGVTVSSTGNPTPTGSVTLTSGAYTSSAATLSSGAANITVAAGSLAQGTDTLTVTYTPDSASSSTYGSATGTNTVVVDALQTPTVVVSPGSSTISTAQSLTVSVTVDNTTEFGTPTGAVKLTSGSYASSSTTLAAGKASIVIPAGSLATGSDTLTVTYTPDSTSTPIYNSNTGTASVTVSSLPAPTVAVTPGSSPITIGESLTVGVTVSDTGNPTPTGSVKLTSGSYTSSAATLTAGAASITVAAGSLAQGTDTLTVTYTPDSGSSSTYTSSTGTSTVVVDALQTPTVVVSPGSSSISTAQSLTVSVTVNNTTGFGTPTGAVKLTSGSYASSSTTLTAGKASIVIPAGSLATGSDTLTVAYTPDSTSTPIYNSNTGSATVTVTGLPTPTVVVAAATSPITTGETLAVSITVQKTSGNPTPTGSVKLTGGGYTSSAATLAAGAASITIPAGSLAQGTDTLSVTYTPDTTSSTIYSSSTGTTTVVVDAIQSPGVTVAPSATTITIDQPVSVSVTVAATTGFGTPTGTVKLTGGGYTSSTTTLTAGAATINIAAGSLATGADTLTVTYTPDATSSPIYSSNTGTHSVTVDPLQTPTLTVVPTPTTITTAQTVSVKVTVAGTTGFATPTGSIKLTSGAYSSAATTLTSGVATISVPAGALATGSDTLAAAYTPDTTSAPIYISASGNGKVTVSPVQNPTVTVTPSPTTITTGESLQVTVNVAGTTNFGTPTGSVKLTSGSYASAATTLSSGSATITVPGGSLAAGSDTLSVAYTPDSSSSTIYNGVSGNASVTVDPLQKPAVAVTPSATTVTTAETLSVTVQVSNTTGFATPTGSVKLTSGSYASAATTLSGGSATISVAAAALATASDTLTATYTPDSTSSPIYTSNTGTVSVTVDPLQIPTVTVTPAATSINASQSLVVTVAVAGTTPFGIPTGSVSLVSGSYTSTATTLSSGSVQITIPAGSLAVATDSIEAIYSPDSASSVIYATANGMANVTVTPAPGLAPGPGGTTTLSVAPGATTGNTGTVSVIGTNGFTGTVNLTCAVTTALTNVTDMPTCSLNPASINITGAAAQTSTLTVGTTGTGSAANEKPNLFWPTSGGTALALLLFFITPRRRRSWLTMVAIVVMVAAMGLTACGKNKPAQTTAGAYTVTVTGTSGTITATVGTIDLTVQ